MRYFVAKQVEIRLVGLVELVKPVSSETFVVSDDHRMISSPVFYWVLREMAYFHVLKIFVKNALRVKTHLRGQIESPH